MPSTRPLVGLGATLGVLALVGASVAWWAGGASATPGRPAVPRSSVVAPEPTTSTSAPSPSTTSTSTTSTTVKPRSVTTTAPPARTTVSTAPPTTAAPTPPVARTAGTSPAERCAAAQQWVAQHGLALPPGWGFRCPGSAVVGGAPRWGLACWNCEGAGSWIAVDIGRIGPSEQTLRHVIAHETCHAIEYTTLGLTTELTADLCAALHGAPRP